MENCLRNPWIPPFNPSSEDNKYSVGKSIMLHLFTQIFLHFSFRFSIYIERIFLSLLYFFIFHRNYLCLQSKKYSRYCIFIVQTGKNEEFFSYLKQNHYILFLIFFFCSTIFFFLHKNENHFRIFSYYFISKGFFSEKNEWKTITIMRSLFLSEKNT